MTRSHRLAGFTLLSTLALTLAGASLRAQLVPVYVPGGSFASLGIGQYYSALGRSIDTDTMIRLNEYIYQSYKQENEEKARKNAERIARNKAKYNAILDRIRNHPEEADLERGDALNSLREQLGNPRIAPSAFRASPIELTAEKVRGIPFTYGPEGSTFSIQRLVVKGTKWPVAFRGDTFAAERRRYERTLDQALELELEGKLSRAAITALEEAVAGLASRLEDARLPQDKVYIEGRALVRRLEAATKLFKIQKIEHILGEIDKYSGSTVEELIQFMIRNNLRFGVPEIGKERTLYLELYTSLKTQYEAVRVGFEDDAK